MVSDSARKKAIASLVLGIVAIVCWFFGWSVIVSIVCGIVGIVMANKAKAEGFIGGMRTAGLVCSIVGLVGAGVALIILISIGGIIGAALMFA